MDEILTKPHGPDSKIAWDSLVARVDASNKERATQLATLNDAEMKAEVAKAAKKSRGKLVHLYRGVCRD